MLDYVKTMSKVAGHQTEICPKLLSLVHVFTQNYA